MKKNIFSFPLFALAGVLLVSSGPAALAQDESGSSLMDGWFVRTGARLMLNAKASVKLSAPPASATMYDNGYVLPDSSGNSGLTWNWGYTSASQVSGDSLNFTRLDNTAAGTVKDGTSDTSIGGEIIMGSELGRFELGKREVRYGVEFGYGYNPFAMSYAGVATGPAAYTDRTYGLNGVVPPEGPYSGTFNGPGATIGTTPLSSTTINADASSTYAGQLDSSLHNLKLGVWFELPVSKKMEAGLSIGYSSLYADTQLKFSENVTYSDPGIPVVGQVTRTVGGRAWNPGAYVQARLSYLITPKISAYVNGDYQYNGRFNFSGAGRDVTLDFSALFSFGAGVSYKF